MLKILLVSGGYIGSYLDSTELFDANLGGWTSAKAALPNPMSGLIAATIDNRVYAFGIDILY